jgi:DNA-binding MarR family transcriptional regulator
MTARLPLPTLLSQVLIAFTIEFDNEAEHRMPHRTTTVPTAADSRPRPWLVSMAMWSNFLQFVTADGVPLHELGGQARITNLGGLERWRYVVVKPDPADSRPKPPRADWLVRPTPGGRRAQEIWRPLAGEIEQRWQARFGAKEIGGLRSSLQDVTRELDPELPFYLPVVWHQMFAALPPLGWAALTRRPGATAPGLDLSVLLSRALLAFALDFERESQLSLTISANALRILGDRGVAVRDLPRLAGVSKEAISMSVGFLERNGYVAVEPDPAAARTKLARLTPKGQRAQEAYRLLLAAIEERWETRFGADSIGGLRAALQGLLSQAAGGQAAGGQPRMSQGLRPYPDGWRAQRPYVTQTTAVVADPAGTLPHYPMVLHRGGWPDGS